MNIKTKKLSKYSNLAHSKEKHVSFFEFWPTWLIYLPVAFQWLILAVRYRSLTLPLIANPLLTVSGMVGVPKSELLQQASDECSRSILPWKIHIVKKQDINNQVQQWLELLQQHNICLPFVCKPDIGCRGAGVKLVKTKLQLKKIMSSYPIGSALMAQTLSSWEPEVGIFFVRQPGEKQGKVISLTKKLNPEVIGDGTKTLAELVKADARARLLLPIYKQRHFENWQKIVPANSNYRLVFSASHCRGAIFTDAREHITTELTEKINQIMSGIPEFHYGRLDVKYSNLDDLKLGKNLQIVEINGASAESIHIWDKNARLSSAIKTLLWQYKTLFKIGALNRKRGYKPPSLKTILKLWKKERSLSKHYPVTD